MAKIKKINPVSSAFFQQWLGTAASDSDIPMPDVKPVTPVVPAPITTITSTNSTIGRSASKTPAITDADRQRALNIVSELQKWQAGKTFYEERVVSLFTLINELDYLEVMIAIGAHLEPYSDDDQHPTLPLILQPRGVKIRVHDDLHMVIGISRKSSRPPPLYFDAQTAEYRKRAGQYADFYMSRVHSLGDHVDCCEPVKESVVVFGSSNTDFENSNVNGIKDLRNLLKQATEDQKVVLVCSQADGLCTNMIGLAGFLEPFLEKRIQLELMVWWNNSKFYIYDVQKLIHQFHARADGYAIESHYEELLGKMARVAGNKEQMASASRANKEQGLGFRNAIEIDPDDDSPEREIITISMTAEAKQQRHIQGLQNSTRVVSEVPLSRHENGKLRSPIDDRTFESIPCKHVCPYKAKTEADMTSHLEHAHRLEDEKVEKARIYDCDQCKHEPFTSQYHLNRHIDNSHNSMPVTCVFCQSELKNQYGLEDHIRRVCPALPKNETQCQLCNKKVWAKKLADHIRVHVRSDQVAAFGAIMGVGQ